MRYAIQRYLPIAAILVFANLMNINNVNAADVTLSAMLANSCASCHGTDGHSPGAIPSIAGKSIEFLEKALKEFRSGERDSTVMGRHAKGYTDDEIKLLAQYFSGQK